ncbi:MAG: amidohydrolase family protein [bacterium]|nr:amidohydrolase family protein [bacterium]
MVDIESNSISKCSILIENGRISQVSHPDSLKVPDDAELIKAVGKYIIPGLWDMHTHVGSQMAPYLTLPLFVANGITNIREMGGQAKDEDKLRWKKEIESHVLQGPRFQSMAGVSVGYLNSDEQARSVVSDFSSESPDFIKVFNAVLPEYYTVMQNEANKYSIPVLGHKPRAVNAMSAVKAGFKSIEHARLFLFECYPGAEGLRERYRLRYTGEDNKDGRVETIDDFREMLETHSDSMFVALVEEMILNNTWFCPTHVTRKMDAFADNFAFRNDHRLKYINRYQRFNWNRDADGMINDDPTPRGRKAFMDFYLKGLELTGEAHKKRLKILAGTDANDAFCIPGFALHDELQELVKAGLTPAEALKCATILPAEYVNCTHEYGSIEKGKVADIVILNDNPLTDIANTQKIHMVLYNGNVYDRSELDNLLEFVERTASSWSVLARLIWSQLN